MPPPPPTTLPPPAHNTNTTTYKIHTSSSSSHTSASDFFSQLGLMSLCVELPFVARGKEKGPTVPVASANRNHQEMHQGDDSGAPMTIQFAQLHHSSQSTLSMSPTTHLDHSSLDRGMGMKDQLLSASIALTPTPAASRSPSSSHRSSQSHSHSHLHLASLSPQSRNRCGGPTTTFSPSHSLQSSRAGSLCASPRDSLHSLSMLTSKPKAAKPSDSFSLPAIASATPMGNYANSNTPSHAQSSTFELPIDALVARSKRIGVPPTLIANRSAPVHASVPLQPMTAPMHTAEASEKQQHTHATTLQRLNKPQIPKTLAPLNLHPLQIPSGPAPSVSLPTLSAPQSEEKQITHSAAPDTMRIFSRVCNDCDEDAMYESDNELETYEDRDIDQDASEEGVSPCSNIPSASSPISPGQPLQLSRPTSTHYHANGDQFKTSPQPHDADLFALNVSEPNVPRPWASLSQLHDSREQHVYDGHRSPSVSEDEEEDPHRAEMEYMHTATHDGYTNAPARELESTPLIEALPFTAPVTPVPSCGAATPDASTMPFLNLRAKRQLSHHSMLECNPSNQSPTMRQQLLRFKSNEMQSSASQSSLTNSPLLTACSPLHKPTHVVVASALPQHMKRKVSLSSSGSSKQLVPLSPTMDPMSTPSYYRSTSATSSARSSFSSSPAQSTFTFTHATSLPPSPDIHSLVQVPAAISLHTINNALTHTVQPQASPSSRSRIYSPKIEF